MRTCSAAPTDLRLSACAALLRPESPVCPGVPFPGPEQGGCSSDDGERDHSPQNGPVVLLEEAEYLFAVHRSQPGQQPVTGGARQPHGQKEVPFGIFQRTGNQQEWRERDWRRQQRRHKETPETISFKQAINPVRFFL